MAQPGKGGAGGGRKRRRPIALGVCLIWGKKGLTGKGHSGRKESCRDKRKQGKGA